MVQLGLYRSGWPVFPPRARMLSRFKLLLKAMVQLQFRFVLMSVTAPQGAKGIMHVEIRGSCCAGPALCWPRGSWPCLLLDTLAR